VIGVGREIGGRCSFGGARLPNESNRLSEAMGNAQPPSYCYTLNRADLSDVAFAAERIASSLAGVVGAVVYRGPREG
jgi:hypothetical protein